MNNSLVSKIRKENSLTQENLAEMSHVTVRTIQRIEAGEDVSRETLKSVSNALGVTVSDLFESVDSFEKEVELMEYSKEQKKELDFRKYEKKSFELFSIGIAVLLLGSFGLLINTLSKSLQPVFGILWLFLFFIILGSISYFLNIFLTKKLDRKYPKTVGIPEKSGLPKEFMDKILNLVLKKWWIVLIVLVILVSLILYIILQIF